MPILLAIPVSKQSPRQPLRAARRTYHDTRNRKEFNDRRATDETTLAAEATDKVQAIPHRQLAKLHADEVRASDGAPPLETVALEVAAVDGNVTIETAGGMATALTPQAAVMTSDSLLARARDAERQKTVAMSRRVQQSVSM